MSYYLKKLKKLFFHPTSFFQSVSNEKRYWPVLAFSVFTSILGGVIQVGLMLPAYVQAGGVTAALALALGLLFVVIMAFAGPFIGAAVIHLGILIVGGRQGYFNTFKPVTYAYIITLVYGVIGAIPQFILSVILPESFLTFQAGTQMGTLTADKVSHYFSSPLFYVSLSILIVIAVISIIHYLYAEVVGLALFQKISRGRAFASIALSFVLLFFLAFMFVMGISVLFAGIALLAR